MADHAAHAADAPRAGTHLKSERRNNAPPPLAAGKRGEGASPAQAGGSLPLIVAVSQAEEEALLEAGRLLFAGPCRFVHAAQRLDQLPPPRGPEVAFAGRSNVGKSSLLNALTGRRALARVSITPGRTRQLNFFDLAGRLSLVDMPGYGYARAGKAVKADWQGLMFDYLRGRATLRRVLLLLDARVELKEADRAVMELLDRAAVTFQLVLTKADELPPEALARKQAEARELARRHPAALHEVVVTSSASGAGVPALRAILAALAG
jgi:GTP-binding protein